MDAKKFAKFVTAIIILHAITLALHFLNIVNRLTFMETVPAAKKVIILTVESVLLILIIAPNMDGLIQPVSGTPQKLKDARKFVSVATKVITLIAIISVLNYQFTAKKLIPRENAKNVNTAINLIKTVFVKKLMIIALNTNGSIQLKKFTLNGLKVAIKFVNAVIRVII